VDLEEVLEAAGTRRNLITQSLVNLTSEWEPHMRTLRAQSRVRKQRAVSRP